MVLPVHLSSLARLCLELGIAGAVAYGTTPLAIAAARRFAFLDVPAGYKGHGRPTPYLGGVAVVLAFALAALAAASDADRTLPLIAAALVLLVVGTIDDRRTVSPAIRVAVEFALGAALSLLRPRVASGRRRGGRRHGHRHLGGRGGQRLQPVRQHGRRRGDDGARGLRSVPVLWRWSPGTDGLRPAARPCAAPAWVSCRITCVGRPRSSSATGAACRSASWWRCSLPERPTAPSRASSACWSASCWSGFRPLTPHW